MRPSRIRIKNFRNFLDLDLVLGPSAVIVGENTVGKSNLLEALRLVLDPTLPDSSRQLELDDFHDGVNPLSGMEDIEIAIEFTEFDDDPRAMAWLGGYMVSAVPMTARVTYCFRPRSNLIAAPTNRADFEFLVYGGLDEGRQVRHDMRREFPLTVLGALRDAEGDLRRWSASPLRPLLDRALAEAPGLEPLVKAIRDAEANLGDHPAVVALADAIAAKTTEMAGPHHDIDLTLALTPSDSLNLLRSLRLFFDAGRRTIADASLGATNVLYLALRSLVREQALAAGEFAFATVCIEEPEAHLHPQLQRLIYRDLLGTPERPESPRAFIIVTTHSPHIASVAPLRSILLLKTANATSGTVAASAATADLTDAEVADIERYLDVTRAEMLFARGVILVEGVAEQYLVPAFAASLGISLDSIGVTVCAIGGTHFQTYAKLLSPGGLDLPFVVVTDLDPRDDGSNLGFGRAGRIARALGFDPAPITESSAAEQFSVYLNESTLEWELASAGSEVVIQALLRTATTKAMRERADAWRDSDQLPEKDAFFADIAAIGKGRFAQALAPTVGAADCPPYIERAIRGLAASVT